MSSLDKLFEAGPEGKWRLYLTERDGGTRVKEFECRRSANKYIHKRHDSVVSYKAYLLIGQAELGTFIKEGVFKPRTAEWHRRDKARLRRKKRARRRAREEAAKLALAQRPARW